MRLKTKLNHTSTMPRGLWGNVIQHAMQSETRMSTIVLVPVDHQQSTIYISRVARLDHTHMHDL
jgi:hypothetical protein